jgi:hypothetical protein
MKRLAAWLCCALITLPAFSQPEVIQLSGMVLTSDSLSVIPLTTIRVQGPSRGTTSDYTGFFTITVKRSDTLRFTCVGFKEARYVVPDSLDRSRYSIVQLMTQDTVHLPGTVIYPWPKPGELKDALLALNIPDDDMERARKNLDRERLKEVKEQMGVDANEAQDYYARADAYKLYYYGQSPPIQILNPFAWAEFFKAWKRGDFRKQ